MIRCIFVRNIRLFLRNFQGSVMIEKVSMALKVAENTVGGSSSVVWRPTTLVYRSLLLKSAIAMVILKCLVCPIR
jgi:hypothetical protein